MTEKSVATLLVELAEDAYELVLDLDGQSYAVPTGRRVALPIDGGRSSLRAALAALYFETYDKAPGRNAVAEALEVLRGRAQTQPRRSIPLRHGRLPDSSVRVIDLGGPDEHAVLIFPRYEHDDDTWTVQAGVRTVFRRTALTAPMAEPAYGVGVDELQKVLNVRPADWPLLVGWLVAVTLGDVPVPVLLFTGEQGTGKTSAARTLVQLVDASSAPVRAAPRDVESWVVAAAGSRVVALDNLSVVAEWLSDALCRAVTGDGLVRRQLYTDSELAVTSIRRAVILTSIDTGAVRGDLGERLLTVELEPITPEHRMTEAELGQALDEVLPGALGGLFHLAGCVLGELEHRHVRAHPRPRMADFADVLAALDVVTGWTSLATYLAVIERTMVDLVSGDHLAAAIADVARKDPAGWRGTAQELLELIKPFRPEGKTRWPATPRGLAGAIRRAATGLRAIGVEVEHHRGTGGTRFIALRPSDGSDGSDGRPSVPTSKEAVKRHIDQPSLPSLLAPTVTTGDIDGYEWPTDAHLEAWMADADETTW